MANNEYDIIFPSELTLASVLSVTPISEVPTSDAVNRQEEYRPAQPYMVIGAILIGLAAIYKYIQPGVFDEKNDESN